MRAEPLLLILSLVAYAQNGVFFESDPFGAFVVLNGRVLNQRTPFLLRDPLPGTVRLVVFKEGYEPFQQNLTIPSKGFVRVAAVLRPNTVAVSFSEVDDFVFLDAVNRGRGRLYRLPQGGYRLSAEGDRVRVEPVFAEEGQLVFSTWMLPLTIGASVGLTIRDILEPWLPVMPLSPATLASYALTLFNLGWYYGLLQRRTRFQEGLVTRSETVGLAVESATFLFDRGQTALNAGNLILARNYLSRVLQEHPFHPLAAQSLFLLSRMALIRGDVEEARSLYLSLLNLYPVQDLYDRTVKVLADMAYDRKDKDEVRRLLNLLTFSDGSLTAEDVRYLSEWLEAP